jgi:hypothetical protein
VLLNDGTGHFSLLENAIPPKPFAAMEIALDIDAADVNNDGYQDLFVVFTKGDPFYVGRYIQILVNNQDGTFRDETSTRLPQSDNNDPWIIWVYLHDLDMDGSLDIVAGPNLGEEPLFYLNNGNGFFSQLPNVFNIKHPHLFTFLDVDQNGFLDVLWSYPGCEDGTCPEMHFVVRALGCLVGWDSQAMGSPIVVQDGATFKMWYDGLDTFGVRRIGYAVSSNGLTWTKYISNPVLTGTPGEWDEGSANEPSVIKDSSTLKMWYTHDNFEIGYATSSDGITWTKSLSAPVLQPGTAGSWDESDVSDPFVIKANGTYTMWYEASSSIGCATSSDGIFWTKCAENPVLEPTPASWDEDRVSDAAVVFDGAIYHMWYRGFDFDGPPTSIGYATSTSGITWTKYISNPVLSGTSGEWDDGHLELGNVITNSGLYHMWYMANQQFGYATSTNGISWTKYAGNPILTPSIPYQIFLPVVLKN